MSDVSLWRFSLVSLAGCVILGAGCRGSVPGERVLPCAVSTPSVEAARALPAEHRTAQRPHTRAEVYAKDGKFRHGPLYFEDPFERVPACDARPPGWSAADYGCVFYGPVRFLVNTALFPVSAVVSPPWVLTASGAATNEPPPPGDVPSIRLDESSS